jgi:hypothetical protein
VISQIARQVLGSGPAFLLVQTATLLILVLAANTALSGFPLLASFASGDALLPRQLRKRGHRLVYSNGILALSSAAIFLIMVFRADVHLLIPLYAVGVVTSFTLAQAGMTRRHLRVREPGWRGGIAVNGVGAVVTLVALVVIVVGKFTQGAWMVVIAIPLLASFASGDALLPRQLRKRGHRLVYSNGILALSSAAIFLIMVFRADIHLLIPVYAVGVVTSFTLAQAGMTRRHLRVREPGWRGGLAVNGVGAVVTLVALMVIVVGRFTQGAWMVVIAIPLLIWLLLRVQRTYGRELAQLKVEVSQRLAPPKPRHEVVVLIEALDQAALSALQYARQLNPLSITAMHIAVDPDHARELGRLWAKVHIPFPLELVDAPDRNLLATVEEAVGELVRPDTEVTVLIPRRRYVGFWRRVLHDQTSSGLTAVLGAMENVNVTIVPFHLGRGQAPPRLHAVRGS